MNQYVIFAIIVLYLCDVNSHSFQPGPIDDYKYYYRKLRLLVFNALERNSESQSNLQKARLLNMLQTEVPVSVPFPCNVSGYRSLKPPSNVDHVRPGDIDVIAALGDSITAGFGLVATDILHVFMANRGLSWSIGGQASWRQYLTLPNILKEFNPNLIGYSLRDSLSTHRDSQFNAAEVGAISSELLYMAQVLLTRIRTDPRVDLTRHWKLITIMIGANDFCLDMCYHTDLENVLESHRKDMITVLRLLRNNLPRTIVNIVPPPDVTVLKNMTNIPSRCVTTKKIECYCFFASKYKRNLEIYHDVIRKWHLLDEEISSMSEFHQDEFTVIYQPFLREFEIPRNSQNMTDYSNLSQDCFHLSQKFNAEVANGLWNNMMEKNGQKTKGRLPLFEKFLCPSKKNPYIFTRNNMNL